MSLQHYKTDVQILSSKLHATESFKRTFSTCGTEQIVFYAWQHFLYFAIRDCLNIKLLICNGGRQCFFYLYTLYICYCIAHWYIISKIKCLFQGLCNFNVIYKFILLHCTKRLLWLCQNKSQCSLCLIKKKYCFLFYWPTKYMFHI